MKGLVSTIDIRPHLLGKTTVSLLVRLNSCLLVLTSYSLDTVGSGSEGPFRITGNGLNNH